MEYEMKKIKDFFDEWKITLFILLGITVFAFIIRIFNLNELPVFADEAIYVRWAQIIKNETTLRFIPLSDGKQPLFMWTLWPMLSFFADPLVAGRTLSAITGTGTLLGIFLATYLLFQNKKASLLAAGLYALSPFAVFFDRMALVDSMLSLFGIWAFVFGVLTVKFRRIDTAIAAGVMLGAAWLTKSPALFMVLMLPSLLLLEFKRKKLTNLIWPGVLLAGSAFLAYGMFNILRLGPNFHLLSSRNLDYVYPYSHILDSPLNPLITHLIDVFNYWILLAPLGLIILAGIAKLSLHKKYLREILLIIIWGALPVFIVATYSKTMTARYIYFAFPYLIILAASSLLVKKELLKKLVYAGIALFIIQSVYTDFLFLTNVEAAPLPRGERSGYLEEWTAGYGIREVADYIRKESMAPSTNRQIIVGTEGYFGTLPDGLQIYLNDISNVTVIGVGINLTEVPESLEESVAAGNPTYLVINNSRLHLDPEKEGLELIESFPKALKSDGTRDELLFFRVNDRIEDR